MNKVLISAYTGLGNFILKTPMISKIKELYPDCKIDIIAGNNFGTEFILKDSYLIDSIYILKETASLKEKVLFFYNLRKLNYDAIFLPFDANRKFLFFGSYFAKISHRIVHINIRKKFKTIFFLLMPATLSVPLLQGRHEIDLNYDLLEFYINKPFRREYKTFISIRPDEKILTKFHLQKQQYIVLQIGAANGVQSAKKWPNEYFIELIMKLNIFYPNYKIVTVGDKGDYESYIKPLENMAINFINTAGLTSIKDVANILYFSKVVVANDSGIMHIANALNCNLIALYGPTDYTRTKPIGKNTIILYSNTECFAKMYNFTGNETELLKIYPNCMKGITVMQVFEKLKGIIDDK